jgi:hypothetical protein
VLCFAKQCQLKLMNERSEQFDPHRFIDFISYFDYNNLWLDLCIGFNHQIVEVC